MRSVVSRLEQLEVTAVHRDRAQASDAGHGAVEKIRAWLIDRWAAMTEEERAEEQRREANLTSEERQRGMDDLRALVAGGLADA